MILVTAHEGSEGSPSNTLDSVKAGIEAGADIIEVDVRSTKDGIAVLSHSSVIKTVSGKRIPLVDIDLYNILEMERNGQIKFDHPGGTITKLEEVLDFIKESDLVINLDIKDDECIKSMIKTVKDQKMLDYVFISGCEKTRASFLKTIILSFRCF